jgi:hypothetical protein
MLKRNEPERQMQVSATAKVWRLAFGIDFGLRRLAQDDIGGVR